MFDGKSLCSLPNICHSPTLVNDELVYIKKTKNNLNYVVYENKEIETEFLWISDLININGQLAYVGQKSKGKAVVVHAGKENSSRYDIHLPLMNADGRLAYTVSVFHDEGLNKEKVMMIVGGKVVGGEYDAVRWVTFENNHVAFAVEVGTGINPKTYVIYDGEAYGQQYDYASEPVFVAGRLAYLAKKEQQSFIVLDGVEGKRYDHIDARKVSIAGKLGYYAKSNGVWKMVIEK